MSCTVLRASVPSSYENKVLVLPSPALVWPSWKIGGSVHFCFLPLRLEFGVGADSWSTRGVSDAICTGGMALSVDVPQLEVAGWTFSWRVAEDGLELAESQAFPSGSGLMYEVAGNEAAAGTGGRGCRVCGSVSIHYQMHV